MQFTHRSDSPAFCQCRISGKKINQRKLFRGFPNLFCQPFNFFSIINSLSQLATINDQGSWYSSLKSCTEQSCTLETSNAIGYNDIKLKSKIEIKIIFKCKKSGAVNPVPAEISGVINGKCNLQQHKALHCIAL